MEDPAALESYLGQLMQRLDQAEQSSNSFQKANTIRNLSSQLFAEAQATNDERFAGSILARYLDQYQDTVMDTDTVNNYCDSVAELLQNEDEEEPGITESMLGDPLSYLTGPGDQRRLCQGTFEDCTSWEPSASDLQAVFQRVTQDVVVKEVVPEVVPAKAVVPKATLSAVEEISRRVFGPKPSIFAPKVPIMAKPVPVEVAPPKVAPNEPGKESSAAASSFRTAKDELQIQNVKKYGTANPAGKTPLFAYGSKKSLGGRRTLGSKFVCPIRNDDEENKPPSRQQHGDNLSVASGSSQEELEEVDERLRNIDPKMVELIRNEIMDRFSPVTWDDIAGLEYAKQIIREAIVCPLLRPDIFTGLRKPPRGILLFGPPGTGKTLIGKCIASQSNATFFSISASSLTSKWIGEGEKMVRTLFAVAAVHQPAVVFIDEIDSLLCQRSETEHESSRRLKTEFLIQLDGAATADDERILIVGATNRPQELDEAARRRLVKRLYIPLPELNARTQILGRLLASEKNSLTDGQIAEIGQLTEGFSGADMKVLCHEASMGPIRSISYDQLVQVAKEDVRAVNYDDFKTALSRVRASVSQGDLVQYVQWDRLYGSGSSG
ncbi:fidgetin [Culex quinquefasciatus]|uniref:Fidgetin n=1 Tax=Culex quinquefasciatus TaxID=7176 RepID=B0W0A7_CULQU|nr:fidgetin [Culex quinquefasciatus]|eukprot:XP_001842141.1 fidgetin [Culex quinquefasciatus]